MQRPEPALDVPGRADLDWPMLAVAHEIDPLRRASVGHVADTDAGNAGCELPGYERLALFCFLERLERAGVLDRPRASTLAVADVVALLVVGDGAPANVDASHGASLVPRR